MELKACLKRFWHHAGIRFLLGLISTALGIAALAYFAMAQMRPELSSVDTVKEGFAKSEVPPPPMAQIDFRNPPAIAQKTDHTREGREVAKWYPKGESPRLRELVQAGKLPPVEQRVGPEPLVMKPLETNGKYGGTLMVPREGTSVSFGPFEHMYSANALIRFSPQGYPLVPHLAKDWEASEDKKVFTFYLRRGIHWSDGHPFDADDILYWYEAEVMDPELGSESVDLNSQVLWFRGKRGHVEKVDDYTVRFIFKDPNGLFPERLASFMGRVIANAPEHYLRPFHPRLGDPARIEEAVKGMQMPSAVTAYRRLKHTRNPEIPRMWPWILRRDQEQSPVELVRNPYYFAVDPEGNQLPYLDRLLTFAQTKDLVPLSTAGGAYTIAEVPLPQLSFLLNNQKSGGYRVEALYPAQRSGFTIFPNLNRKVPDGRTDIAIKAELLAEKKFRKALSHAIDRQAIIDAAFYGLGEPAQTGPGTESPYYYPALLKEAVEYDPEKANRMLDDLGLTRPDKNQPRVGPNGEKLLFFFITLNDFDPKIIQMVLRDWRRIGIDVRLRVMGRGLYGSKLRTGAYDFTVYVSMEEHLLLRPDIFIASDHMSYEWRLWHETGGLYKNASDDGTFPSGPPPGHPLRNAMRAYDRYMAQATVEERKPHAREFLEIARENLWHIGIATRPPVFIAVDAALRNYPEKNAEAFFFMDPASDGIETFFFDEAQKRNEALPDFGEKLLRGEALWESTDASGSETPSVQHGEESTGPGKQIAGGIRTLLLVGLFVGMVLVGYRHPFIGRRLLLMIPTLLVVSVLAFFIIQAPPGDFLTSKIEALRLQGDTMSETEIEEYQEVFHLNASLPEQYFRWMGFHWFLTFEEKDLGLLQGHLGRSMETVQSVNSMIGERLLLTLAITSGTVLFTWLLAIPIGVYSAVRQYSAGDYVFTFFGMLGMCIPDFLLAIIVLFIGSELFGMTLLGLFSPEFAALPGWTWAKFLDLASHIWVPIVILGTTGTAAMIRVMRGNLLDELHKPYVTTARAKGVRPLKLLLKYPVRIAINPFVSTLGGLFPHLVSGGAITAIILSLPTIGPLLLGSFESQDMYLAGSLLMILSLLGVVGTLVSDLLLLAIDPRIRMEEKSS